MGSATSNLMGKLMDSSPVEQPSAGLRRRKGPKRYDLSSTEHGKEIDSINERLNYSADAKREIEREAMMGYQEVNAYLDIAQNPWPAQYKEPILAGLELAKLASGADAVFSSPPLMDYQAGENTSWEEAHEFSALIGQHVLDIRPRRKMLAGWMDAAICGTKAWLPFWEYEESEERFWQRFPKEETVIDPRTGQPYTIWREDGNWKEVYVRRITKDRPNFRSAHITEWFPDDNVSDEQESEWHIFRRVMSTRQCEERVLTDQWDPAAVARAKDEEMDFSTKGDGSGARIGDMLDWQQSIGIKTGQYRDSLMKRTGRGSVEVLECWRRTKHRMERLIVLNRRYIAWHGRSPYNHSLYPLVVQRNISIDGQFWGLGDFRLLRWQLRGYGSMRSAGLSDAQIAVMPPLLVPDKLTVTGKRWEPRAEWYIDGPSELFQHLRFFEPNGNAGAIAHREADLIMSRMDSVVGSSEVSRGNSGGASGQKATTVSLAYEAAGKRERLSIGNTTDEFLEPLAWFFAKLVQQNQDYVQQVQLTGDSKAEPVTIDPLKHRRGNYVPIQTASTSALKALNGKRILELSDRAQAAMQTWGRFVKWDKMAELVVESVAPDKKSQVLKSAEELQEEMMAAGVQGVGPGQAPHQMPPQMGGPPQNPNPPAQPAMNEGSQMQEMAADMAAGMSL